MQGLEQLCGVAQLQLIVESTEELPARCVRSPAEPQQRGLNAAGVAAYIDPPGHLQLCSHQIRTWQRTRV